MKRSVVVGVVSLLLGTALVAVAVAAGAPGDATRGASVFAQKCAVCHGTTGQGNGPAELVLFPKPRDLTSGKFKIRSAPTLPTDDDLLRVVTQGIPGTAMPGFGVLTERERRDVVAYVKTLSPVWTAQPAPPPIAIPAPPPRTPALLALGKKFYADAECLKCHGAGGRGDGESADTLRDEWGYAIVPYDFTMPGRMKAGSGVRDVYRTLRNGIGGTPMPAYGDSLSEEETWALAYYVLSLSGGAPRAAAPVENGTVRVRRVRGDIAAEPSAKLWRGRPLAAVPLRTLWLRAKQIPEVRVAAVHNGRDIGVLLEWDDPSADVTALGVEQFRDAVAVQFPVRTTALHAHGHPEPSYVMGETDNPVNVWHWKADWQLDVARYRDREDRFARVVVDDAPFVREARSSSPEAAAAGVDRHDPLFVTGRAAGNPMSRARSSAVESLIATGVGTITSQPPDAQVVRGTGRWADGTWRVVIVRALRTSNAGDAQLGAGEASAVAFAVWDGAERDRNGQKAVSVWQRLVLEP
ncbi:MAG: c-type cytochrome [Candidatus Rokubacteria bacterium]|nr:c-type cytochrome [Candidatus Rokubacteria bacterium]